MTTETTAMLLAAGAAILVIVLFIALDCLFNKPVCTEDIPHTPKPPIPNPQPLKRLPPIAPIVKRAVAIPLSGAVEVALLLYLGTAERLLIITKIDSGDADDNKRRADELVDAINKLLNYTRL